MPTILVTGGFGFIGSHLVEALLKDKNNQVIVIDDGRESVKSPDGVYEYATDIVEIANKRWNFDVIFHLAALSEIQASLKEPLEYFKVNALGTAAVLEVARECGAKVVYAGSSSAEDYFGSPHAFSKYTGEQLCKMYSKVYKTSTVIARVFNVYGDRHSRNVIAIFEGQASRGKPLTITGDGTQRRDFTHVSDIVSGLISLSDKERSGEVFNLGTGQNYSLNEVAEMFGGAIKYIPSRDGEVKSSLADISETFEATGWKPKSDLKDYVREKSKKP